MTDATEANNGPLPPEVKGLFAEAPAADQFATAQAPKVDPAAEWTAAIDMGAAMLCAMKPALSPVWTAEKRAQLGAAVAGVASKYGWTAGGLFEKYAAEITLAMIAVPLLLETRAALMAEAPAAAAPAADPAADGGAGTAVQLKPVAWNTGEK